MKNAWIRPSLVVGVLLVMAAGAWTLAIDINVDAPQINIIKKDTTSCRKLQYYCNHTCEESPYTGVGLCREGKDGPTSAISVVCCCCTEGSEHRYYIGG